MKPTSKLRWVQRNQYVPGVETKKQRTPEELNAMALLVGDPMAFMPFDQPPAVEAMILQQWFAPEHHGQVVEHEGEWRDLPIEGE